MTEGMAATVTVKRQVSLRASTFRNVAFVSSFAANSRTNSSFVHDLNRSLWVRAL